MVRDHALPAEVAQDTFLRAWQQLGTVRDPAVFGGWLLRIARNTALNRLRSERRTTAVDDVGLAVIERAGSSPATAPAGFRVEDRLHAADDPATAVEDDEIVSLVTEAAAALEGRDAEVLDLGLRLGLSPAEVGEAVGLNRNAANQAVHRARRRLRTAVEARVLWRRGRPDCPDLADALAAAGVERFGAAAVAVADAHAGGCARCTEQRRLRLDPAVLFGAVPLVGAPGLLKGQIAHALSGQGVPMGGSAHAGAATGGSGGGSGDGTGGSGGPEQSGASGGDAGDATSTAQATGDAPTDPASSPGPPGDPTLPVAAAGAPLPADPAAPVEPVDPGEPRRGPGRAILAGVVVLVVLALVAGGILVLRDGGDGDPRQGAAPATRPADLVTPTTAAVPTTAAPEVIAPEPVPVPETEAPRVVTPPVTVAPTEPPPPPPVATGTISISPSTKSGVWSMSASDAPRLTWTSTNAASVTVEGPGVTSSAPSGSAVLCPPTGTSAPVCTGVPGMHRYRLTLRDAAGGVVLTQDAVLVIG